MQICDHDYDDDDGGNYDNSSNTDGDDNDDHDGDFHLMGPSLSTRGLTEIIGNQNIDRQHSERP